MKGKKITVGREGLIPVESDFGVKVVSTGLIIEDADVITWYHDMRRGATEEFCSHVAYGELDYLVVDLPPGTGSDTINMIQYIPDLSGAIIVTIAAEVSQATARAYQNYFNFLRPNSYKGNKAPWEIIQQERPRLPPETLLLPPVILDESFRQNDQGSKIDRVGQYVPVDPAGCLQKS